MHPRVHASAHPDKAAVVMAGSGRRVTYRQLDEGSRRLARLLRRRGLRTGDDVAVLMENNPTYLEAVWAPQRSGLYYTAVNSRLTAPEVEHIVSDCGARALITSHECREVAGALVGRLPAVRTWLMCGGTVDGYEPYEEAVGAEAATELPDAVEGRDLLYSSGTTGRPKGVKAPLPLAPVGTPDAAFGAATVLYGFDEDTVYLSPAPLHHAAPLRFTMAVHRAGGTAVVMERFDPVELLRSIERHRVSHTQVVPTMLVRLLKLPEAERRRFDLSSLRCCIHAAAPCPVPVKERMIEWWGPILHEYYAGTEGNGFVACNSEEWLAHRGTVGRALLGTLHVLDDDGTELPPGRTGVVWFEGGPPFEYHNDPDTTRASRNDRGWSTLGDIGYVDDEGYLYLTDRKAHMIVSGGVNISPQEAEDVLLTHPRVMDAAVVGVPHEELGEEVKAVVQPVDAADAGPELEQELLAWCRDRLSSYKCPRSVDFDAELPRHPTGKLYKRLVKARYWGDHPTRIV